MKLLVSHVVPEVVGLRVDVQLELRCELVAAAQAAVQAEPAIVKLSSPSFQGLREDSLSRPVPSQKLRALPWMFEILRNRNATSEGDLDVEYRHVSDSSSP